jgi:hypothetical protein
LGSSPLFPSAITNTGGNALFPNLCKIHFFSQPGSSLMLCLEFLGAGQGGSAESLFFFWLPVLMRNLLPMHSFVENVLTLSVRRPMHSFVENVLTLSVRRPLRFYLWISEMSPGDAKGVFFFKLHQPMPLLGKENFHYLFIGSLLSFQSPLLSTKPSFPS